MKFSQLRNKLLSGLIINTLLVFTVHAGVQDPDFRQKASDKVWHETLEPELFPGIQIEEGAEQDVIQLKAPFRAEDAAIVPISVHTNIEQSTERFIQQIHIYVDKNPTPLVGIFEFTPQSGKADLAMRIRVDQFTYVRAIAVMNTGEHFMSKSFVRASGACSAPPPKNIDDSIANLGQMKIKSVGSIEANSPSLMQLKIKHPNITGMQPLRIGSRVMPPPHFVSNLDVDYNGETIMKASMTFSISMDPALRFYFMPKEAGVMTISGSDTKKNQFSETFAVEL